MQPSELRSGAELLEQLSPEERATVNQDVQARNKFDDLNLNTSIFMVVTTVKHQTDTPL